MTKIRLTNFFTIIFCFTATAWASSSPRLRPDLRHAEKLLCPPAKLELSQAWKLKIYETLLAAKLTTHAISAHTAKNFAAHTANFGYMFGKCKTQKHWLLSVSAPFPAKISHNSLLLNPELKKYCRSLTAMHAPSGLLPASSMPIHKHKITLPQQRGLVAVSCRSLHPTRTGPRLLYAIPIKSPSLTVPLMPQQATAFAMTSNWIKALRKKLKRKPLKYLPYKKDQPPRFSVIHDRQELQRQKQKLAQKRIEFVGENRVTGKNVQEALGLLWVSPYHRQLLLHEEADRVYISTTRKDKRMLIVMIFARK